MRIATTPLADALALVITVATFNSAALADGSSRNFSELRSVRNVTVHMQDAVTGGCLSNPNALKVEAEQILRRSGIAVSEDLDLSPAGSYQLGILAFGFEHEVCGCVAELEVDLHRTSSAPEGHLIIIPAYSHGLLASCYAKSEMQEVLRTGVSEFISDLTNEIVRARGNSGGSRRHLARR